MVRYQTTVITFFDFQNTRQVFPGVYRVLRGPMHALRNYPGPYSVQGMSLDRGGFDSTAKELIERQRESFP